MLHIFAAGLWIGCAAAEVVLETFRRRQPDEMARPVIVMHYYIDLFVEGPAILLALGTGIYLAEQAPLASWALIKLVAASIAAGANLVSIWVIVLRKRASDAGDSAELDAVERRFTVLTVVAVPLALVAVIIAMVRAFA